MAGVGCLFGLVICLSGFGDRAWLVGILFGCGFWLFDWLLAADCWVVLLWLCLFRFVCVIVGCCGCLLYWLIVLFIYNTFALFVGLCDLCFS